MDAAQNGFYIFQKIPSHFLFNEACHILTVNYAYDTSNKVNGQLCRTHLFKFNIYLQT